MESNTLSLKALFSKDIRYIIPTFQRPYVWDQEEQWEPLWDDVRNTAERYMDELGKLGEDRAAEAERNTPSHFLGAVILQQQQTAVVEVEQRTVIDGQQRLTTLQLLLDAAQEICEQLELTPEARRLSKLVLNDEYLAGADQDFVFKVWPTNLDRDAFRHAMHNDSTGTSFEESRIVRGHDFFQLQIREWLTADQQAIQKRVAALETTLTGLLQMVVIDLELNDDSHIIFETLNARGTPLIESDLIKNFIMYRSREFGHDEESVYQNHWRTLEDGWWRQDVRQGRSVRPRIDVFLQYWLSMRSVEEVPNSKVFDNFRDYAEPREIVSVAADINRIGETYRALDLVKDPDEAAFIYRWKAMDAGVITPVLLLLFSAPKEVLSPTRRVRALQAIESFLVRRMVCRLTTKDYNHLTLDLVEVLQNQGLEAADDVVIEFLQGQSAESREWPDDEKMNAAFLTLPLYRLLTRGRMRLILEGIEGAMRTSKSEQHSVPKNLTIEHIMPRQWKTHWPAPNGDGDPALAAAERHRLVHTLGNLTLLNSQLNPALSNGPWHSKREGLDKHSVLFLNKNLLGQSDVDRWDETTIANRGRGLAKIAAQVWPGPKGG